MTHSKLGMTEVKRRTGTERFRCGGRDEDCDLLGFWQWACSDLLSNTMRGVIAEFLVARAMGMTEQGVRREWESWDLEIDRIKIEVKSAAYLQRWHQDRPSSIHFRVPKTRGWDPATNRETEEISRHAHVYVLALLDHHDKASVDPLDLEQWKFFVLPTRVLDERTRSQHSITLRSLELLTPAVTYHELPQAVRSAAQAPSSASAGRAPAGP